MRIRFVRLSATCIDSTSGGLYPKDLVRLLQSPVTARWRDIGRVYADGGTGELLLRLPSLTALELSYSVDTTHLDFPPQLPRLSSLRLDCDKHNRPGWHISADAMLAALVHCIGITELDLKCGFQSAHWSALFAKLTSIQKLTIREGEMESLACYASGPITASLEELSIRFLYLPPSELPHLYALRRLRALQLHGCFRWRLGDDTIDSLTPPSILPALTDLGHSWRLAYDGRDDVERRGSSFEWMQARLTQ